MGSRVHRLNSCSQWALEHRLHSCGGWALLLHSMWDLLAQELNLCLLHWQTDSLPQSHYGSPNISVFGGSTVQRITPREEGFYAIHDDASVRVQGCAQRPCVGVQSDMGRSECRVSEDLLMEAGLKGPF